MKALLSIGLTLVLSCSLWATPVDISADGATGVVVNIDSSESGWTQGINPVTGVETWSWSTHDPYEVINDSGEVIATFTDLDISFDLEALVKLNFSVDAGALDTSFTINSGIVAFPTMVNPLAYASAGMTVTGDGDGAAIAGLYAPDKSYKAIYNGSNLFGNYLVSSFSADIFSTGVNKERTPLGTGNWQIIPGSVSSIQSQFHFTLSAQDSASGTSVFELKVPEPATIALLGLGSIFLLRRNSD